MTSNIPKEIIIEGKKFHIEIKYLWKKNSSASIKENSLEFRFPRFISKRKEEEHFQKLLNNLVKKIKKNPHHFTDDSKDLIEKGYFNFAGEKFYIVKNHHKKKIYFSENTFYSPVDIFTETLEKEIPKLLAQRYSYLIEEKVKELNKKTFNYFIKKVETKFYKSKWGHCTSNNTISINIKLLNAPKEVLEYVIIHELAHIKVKSHSREFWREVEKFCPHHRKIRKYLRENPPKIFNE